MAVGIKFKEFLEKRIGSIRSLIINWGSLFFISYLVASTLSSSFIMLVGKDSVKDKSASKQIGSNSIRIDKQLNYVMFRKRVEKRNLFNSDGEFPDEEIQPEPDSDEDSTDEAFNNRAKCPDKSSLPLELYGTIAMGAKSPNSLATVYDKEDRLTDVYKVGDQIIGHEYASIYSIDFREVVLNNKGKKECLKLKTEFELKKSDNKTDKKNKTPEQPEQEEDVDRTSSTVTLDNAYVTEALAKGFAKALKTGRFVPYSRENKLMGFKLTGVKKGSLYTKIGLKNGDVLTAVNGTSMAQAEQGFAMLTAMAEVKEVRVEYLKGGKDPTTLTIVIK